MSKNNSMKKILMLTAIWLTASYVQAQVQPEPEDAFKDKSVRFQGQVGFDASNFLKQFVVPNDAGTAQTSPFNFNAKFLTGFRSFPSLLIGPRLGVGYSSSHSYSNNETQSNERSDDSKLRAARIGLELQHLISKRWILYYGLDYINQTATFSTVTTSTIFGGQNVRTEIISNDKSFGYGPIMGVQFNINKWICLSTETAFYSVQSKGGTKITSSNPNNTTPETFTDSKETQIVLPFFVNFNIVF